MISGKFVCLIILVVLLIALLIRRRHKHHNPYEQTFTVNGRDYTVDVRRNISDDDMADIEREVAKLRAENRVWEQQYGILMIYQSNGIEFEKHKNIEGAISEYEKALKYGRKSSRMTINNYLYSAERLFVLYRKRKEYDKEISLIQEILKEDLPEKKISEFEYRLERATLLKSKQNE